MKNTLSSLLTKHIEIHMTPREKKLVWEAISLRTETLNVNVRKPILSRLYYRGLVPAIAKRGMFFPRNRYVLSVIVSTLIVSGGISAYAVNALPGDALYIIKTNLNENVQIALSLTPEDKAKTAALLATKRLEEVEKLALVGKLTPDAVNQTSTLFNSHLYVLEKQLTKLEEKSKFSAMADVGIFFQTRIAVHVAVLKDIEVNIRILSRSKTKEVADTDIHLVTSVEKQVLTAVVPAVVVTHNAIMQISSSKPEIIETKGAVATLHIDPSVAKEYLTELHSTIGIPASIMQERAPTIVPVLVPQSD